MATWHGYIVIERLNIGADNWSALVALFEQMGTHDSPLPCRNTHDRTRLDGNAVIYESQFDASEITVEQFKQLLADEFSVPVENILDTTEIVDYAGHETTRWTLYYDEVVAGEDRFLVERFGRGGTWAESGDECRAYLAANAAEWEE